VNFLYDDIVHVYTTKYNRLAHRRGHCSIYLRYTRSRASLQDSKQCKAKITR